MCSNCLNVNNLLIYQAISMKFCTKVSYLRRSSMVTTLSFSVALSFKLLADG